MNSVSNDKPSIGLMAAAHYAIFKQGLTSIKSSLFKRSRLLSKKAKASFFKRVNDAPTNPLMMILVGITLTVLPATSFFGHIVVVDKPLPSPPIRKILKPKRRLPLISTVAESDSDVSTLTSYLSQVLSVYTLPALYIASLATSLISMITALRHYSKQKKPSASERVLCISTLIGFFSTALLGIVGYCTADLPWQEISTALSSDLEDTLSEPDSTVSSSLSISSDRREFLEKIQPHFNQKQIVYVFESNYDDSRFLLPRPKHPFTRTSLGWQIQPNSQARLAARELFTEWPLEFISQWYDNFPLADLQDLHEQLHQAAYIPRMRSPRASISDTPRKLSRESPKEKVSAPGYPFSDFPYIDHHLTYMDNHRRYAELLQEQVNSLDAKIADVKWDDWDLRYFLDEDDDLTPALQPEVLPSTSRLPLTGTQSEVEVDALPDRFKKLFDRFFTKIIAILCALTSASMEKKPVTPALITRALAQSEQVDTATADIKDFISIITGDEPTSSVFDKEIAKVTTDLNEFMTMPTHRFANHPTNMDRFRSTITKAESIINTMDRTTRQKFPLLQGLCIAASTRRNELMTTELPSTHRQEPFVVLLRGEPGVGKTELALQLSRWASDELVRRQYSDSFVQITSSDKYWPPLSGQSIALFDDAATARDLSTDLLFANFKGLCSPAYFNASAADVPHKINPVAFKIIFATINPTFDDLATRITGFSDETTWQAMCRRSIILDCTWKDRTIPGNLDKLNPSVHYKKNFSHAQFTQYTMRGGKLQASSTISIAQLKDKITKAYDHEVEQYRRRTKLSATKQESGEGKVHFSVVLHGRSGQGKTCTMAQHIDDISKVLHYPILKIGNISQLRTCPVQRKRVIAYLDDVIKNPSDPETEREFMDFYNNKLVHASVIINATNVSPTVQRPSFGPLISFLRKLPFKTEGVARRMGYSGNISGTMMSPSNLELYVDSFRFFEILGTKTFSYYSIIPAIIFTLVGLLSFWTLPLVLVLPFYIVKSCIFPLNIRAELVPSQLSERIFEKYTHFLDMAKTIQVQHGIVTRPTDVNFELVANRAEDIKLSSDPFDMEQHLFYDRSLFDRTSLSWKLYLDRQIFDTLISNHKKFMITSDGLGYEKIVSLVKRYVIGFKEVGLEPRFYVDIADTGKFSYREGVFTAQIPDNSTQIDVVPTPDGLAVLYTDLVNEPLTVDVKDLLMNPQHAFDNKNASFKQVLAIREFVNTSAFHNNQQVKELLQHCVKEDLRIRAASAAKNLAEYVRTFTAHPLGKLCLVLITIWGSIKAISALVSLYKNITSDSEASKRTGAPRMKLRKNPVATDDEEEKKGKRLGAPKKSPRTNPVATDDDEPQRIKTAQPKPRRNRVATDDETEEQTYKPQSVDTLCDMNNFDAYKTHIEGPLNKSTKALCMLYVCSDKGPTLSSEPVSSQACYGLIMNDKMLLTVGHVADEIHKGLALYAFCDEFKGIGHRLSFVYKYPTRDLSIWYLSSRVTKYLPQSLDKLLITRKQANDYYEINAVICRYATNKVREFHGGSLTFFGGKPVPTDKDPITDYGQLIFGTFSIKMTSGGDCGLPYFACDDWLTQRIIGIHCRGNNTGYTSAGISSTIFVEDIPFWKAQIQAFEKNTKPETSCQFCENPEWKILPSITPKFPGHVNIWPPHHDSSRASFADELLMIFEKRPLQSGLLIKNSGKLHGSVQHSHTQFIPNQFHDLEDVYTWRKSTASEMLIKNGINPATPVWHCVSCVPMSSLEKHIRKQELWGNDFRCYVNIVPHKKTKEVMCKYLVITTNDVTLDTLSQSQACISTLADLPLGNQVYATHDVISIVTGAVSEKQRGVLEDMPYQHVIGNQTVKPIGVFRSTKSHTPTNCFKETPYFHEARELELEHKLPFCTDLTQAHDDELDQLVLDNSSQPSQLATQSIQWAHKIHVPDVDFLKKVTAEFAHKINKYYSRMTEMTDREVLQGLNHVDRPRDAPYFRPLELSASVGFTLKELFYVKEKKDVIACDESGNYTWLDNPASVWLQEQYKEAKAVYQRGQQYFIAFLELLKMEKLKPSKRFLGRTFVCQDFLGVLLERKYLGEFCLRAMRDDPTCGVGVDPLKNFNEIFARLNKFKNQWAADYKRYDRTIPACVFERICDLLAAANPKIAKPLRSCFLNIVYRFQITGRTLSQVYGGMPSGCFPTAPLNSVANDYILFSCFARLCSDFGLAWSWEIYEKNVVRVFYGDDVYISVSDEYAVCFKRSLVAPILDELYGMTIDSSSKDGTTSDFDSFETGTWISRSFRQLDRYTYVVGALKKISINSNFFYTTSNEPTHLAALINNALEEAALWDNEYYEQIYALAQTCTRKCKKLQSLVTFRDRLAVQASVMSLFDPSSCTRHSQDVSALNQKLVFQRVPSVPRNKNYSLSKSNISTHLREFIKTHRPQNNLSEAQQATMANSKVSFLNHCFQNGMISKPQYTCTQMVEKWSATVSFLDVQTAKTYTYEGTGQNKPIAREAAAYKASILCPLFTIHETSTESYLPDYDIYTSRIDLRFTSPEMNVTPGNVIPQAPMMQADASVVPDSGLYTNTNAPTPSRSMNPVAVALDNPAGSGAPFSKHQSCYNIFQRWESKNAVISPALPSGTEVFRLSLDPKDLPKKILDYVLFHDSIIPSLDIIVSIAGAAGTIGWLTLGWVADGAKTKSYTLSDLQQVSMEELNMNGTQVMRFKLDDIRRMGLYRKTLNDPEPYPAIILMVDFQVANVQRNDGVNYPVRVQVKLSPDCILMEPFADGGSSNSSIDFNLGSYFYDEKVDLLIGSSAVADNPDQVDVYDDFGFNTKDFTPELLKCIAVVYNQLPKSTDTAIPVISPDNSLNATYASQIEALPTTIKGQTNGSMMPSKLIFAFGKVSPLQDFYYVSSEPTLLGSVYALTGDFKVSTFTYKLSTMIVQSDGCYIVAIPDVTSVPSAKHGTLLVYNNCLSTQFSQADLDNAIRPDTGKDETTSFIFQDTTHNNEAAGDDFLTPYPIAQTTYYSLMTAVTPKFPTTFVQTGNSMPSTTLPTGLKQISFVRAGTTTNVTEDQPFVPLYKPLLKNAFSALDELIIQNSLTSTVKGDLYINGENRGEVGYNSQTFYVRCDDYKKIIPSTGTDIKIKNIQSLGAAASIAAYNTTGYQSWISSGYRTRRRLNLQHFTCESTIAGIGEDIKTMWEYAQQTKMLNAKLRSAEGIADANNAATSQRNQQAFENSMRLKGASSASAQSGLFDFFRRGSSVGSATSQLDYPTSSPAKSLGIVTKLPAPASTPSASLVNVDSEPFSDDDEDIPTTITTKAQVHANAEPKPDVTKFTTNPVYDSAGASSQPKSSIPDFVPMDPALTKTLNQGRDTAYHMSPTPVC